MVYVKWLSLHLGKRYKNPFYEFEDIHSPADDSYENPTLLGGVHSILGAGSQRPKD